LEHGGAAPAIIDRSADLDRLIEPLTKGGYYHAGQVCVSVQPTGDNYSDAPTDTSDAILAFDAESGELVWSRQTTTGNAYNLACVRAARANCPQANGPDYDFASSAVMTVLPGGKRALIGAQKSAERHRWNAKDRFLSARQILRGSAED
jgi:hypothetical protein